jgi:inward rectifier potassium channel
MYGETLESLRRSQAEFIVLLGGLDEAISAQVNQRTSYIPDEVLWGARFANAFLLAQTRGSKVRFDMQKFDAVERASLPELALNN